MSVRRDDLFISCDCLGPERSGPCYVSSSRRLLLSLGSLPRERFQGSLHLDVDADLVDPRAVIF